MGKVEVVQAAATDELPHFLYGAQQRPVRGKEPQHDALGVFVSPKLVQPRVLAGGIVHGERHAPLGGPIGAVESTEEIPKVLRSE